MKLNIIFILLILCSFNFASLVRWGKLPYVTGTKKRIIPNHLKKFLPQKYHQNYTKSYKNSRKLNGDVEVEPETQEGEIVEGEEGENVEGEEGENIEGEEGENVEGEEGEEEQVEGEEGEEEEHVEGEEEEHVEGEGEGEEEEEEEEEHVEGEEGEEGEEEFEDEEAHEEPLPKSIESEEIQAAIELVEFKMTEINELMKECLETEFAADVMAEKDDVLTECTGVNYQILFQNYKEAILRVKSIFFELIKLKTSELDEEYDDEVSYFLDILEQFIDMDYHVRESLEIAKETVKYYVSPGFFDSLVEFSAPEIDAVEELLANLKESRRSVQELVDEKTAEREEYMNSLKHEAEEIQEHEAEEEDHGEYEEEEEDHGDYPEEEEEHHDEDYENEEGHEEYEDDEGHDDLEVEHEDGHEEEEEEHEDGHEEEHEEEEDNGEPEEGHGEDEEEEEEEALKHKKKAI